MHLVCTLLKKINHRYRFLLGSRERRFRGPSPCAQQDFYEGILVVVIVFFILNRIQCLGCLPMEPFLVTLRGPLVPISRY